MTSKQTSEISTKFTLDGIAGVVEGFKKYGKSASDASEKAEKSAASLADRYRQVEKSVAKAFGRTAFTGVRTSFKGIEIAGTAAFKAIKITGGTALKALAIGALAAEAKIATIGIAAVKSSSSIADMLDSLNNKGNALGVNPEALNRLNYIGIKQDMADGELIDIFTSISDKFSQVYGDISDTNDEAQRVRSLAIEELKNGLKIGDESGAIDAINSFIETRYKNIFYVNSRIKYLEATLAGKNNVYAASEFGRQGLDTAPGRAPGVTDLAIRRELQKLYDSKSSLDSGLGPEGKALIELQSNYGLDINKALSADGDGLMEIADAMERVTDKNKRLELSFALFGKGGGKKMALTMAEGRKAMVEYQKEMEHFGLNLKKKDFDQGAEFNDSKDRVSAAFKGIQIEAARQMLPIMTPIMNEFAEYLANNRMSIVGLMTKSFNSIRALVLDIVDLWNGKTSGLETQWLQKAVDYFRILRIEAEILYNEFIILKSEIMIIANGGNSRFEWMNTLRDKVVDVIKQFEVARTFVTEFFGVFNGQRATTFTGLNTMHEWIIKIYTAARDAASMIWSILKAVESVISPILGLFGQDPLTMLLFLGMGRMVIEMTTVGRLLKGLVLNLGGVASAAKTAWGWLAKIFSGGTAGAAVDAAGGVAAEAVGGAVAGATAARAGRTAATAAEAVEGVGYVRVGTVGAEAAAAGASAATVGAFGKIGAKITNTIGILGKFKGALIEVGAVAGRVSIIGGIAFEGVSRIGDRVLSYYDKMIELAVEKNRRLSEAGARNWENKEINNNYYGDLSQARRKQAAAASGLNTDRYKSVHDQINEGFSIPNNDFRDRRRYSLTEAAEHNLIPISPQRAESIVRAAEKEYTLILQTPEGKIRTTVQKDPLNVLNLDKILRKSVYGE